MISIFKELCLSNNGIITFPRWTYIRRQYLDIISNLINYYRTRAYNVKGNHLLVQLLYHVMPNLNYEPFKFIDLCKIRSKYVSKTFGLTSDIAFGTALRNVFYTKQDEEIIILDENDFDYKYVMKYWRSISPIKILRCPISNIGLMLPNGRDSNTERGLSIFSINIPLYAFMYRCFVRSHISENISYPRFVHSYILPNMLYSQTDQVIMNRLMNMFYGIPNGKSLMKHAIMVPNFDNVIDEVLGNVLKEFEKKSLRYSNALKLIPAIGKNHMQKSLLLDDYIPTRQLKYSYMLSRLDIFNFLVECCGDKSIRLNLDHISKMKRELRYIVGDGSDKIRNMKLTTSSYYNQIVNKIQSI